MEESVDSFDTSIHNFRHRIYGSKEINEVKDILPCAYVDGSYNKYEKKYGFASIIKYYRGDKLMIEEISGYGNDKEMISMRNVSGELMGARIALERALELELKEITIYYDYSGIEMWATGKWKRNKKGTINYHEFVQNIKSRIKVNFKKVAAHTGVVDNEIADKLAKESVGITS